MITKYAGQRIEHAAADTAKLLLASCQEKILGQKGAGGIWAGSCRGRGVGHWPYVPRQKLALPHSRNLVNIQKCSRDAVQHLHKRRLRCGQAFLYHGEEEEEEEEEEIFSSLFFSSQAPPFIPPPYLVPQAQQQRAVELSTELSEIQESHAKQMSQLTRSTSVQMAQATHANQELRSRNEYLERQLEKAKYVLKNLNM